jgi:hypothetical protein
MKDTAKLHAQQLTQEDGDLQSSTIAAVQVKCLHDVNYECGLQLYQMRTCVDL